MNRAMRYFLGVHKFAPTAAVQGDMGWISLKYRRYKKMLLFWNRLNRMDEERLTKEIFLYEYSNAGNSWSNDISCISELLNMNSCYVNMEPFDMSVVDERCMQVLCEWNGVEQCCQNLNCVHMCN